MDPIANTSPVHEQVLKLLPWYVTGELSEGDRRLVADHLTICDSCRAELEPERTINKTVASLPIDVELGWAAMRRRVERGAAPRRGIGDGWRRLPGAGRVRGLHLVLVAQLVLLVAAVAAFAPLTRPAEYHVLGAGAAPQAANALVMFRSDARQAVVARALMGNGARIVDGPTETGALLLHVEPASRVATLARLRAQPEITMAEPIDR